MLPYVDCASSSLPTRVRRIRAPGPSPKFRADILPSGKPGKQRLFVWLYLSRCIVGRDPSLLLVLSATALREAMASTVESGEFTNGRGQKLYTLHFLPKGPVKARIIFHHGAAAAALGGTQATPLRRGAPETRQRVGPAAPN